MKKIIVLCLFTVAFANAQMQKERGKLVWEENFDGNALNEQVWNYELGDGCPNICGWGNNERQIYTTDNHKVANGMLTITVKKDGEKYTSTRITTAGNKEFKYGYIEARAKIPTGHGIWPAFWMLGSNIKQVGWPMAGEIDILEYVGKEPNMVFTSLHTQDSHGNTINTKKTTFENIEEGFHTYAIDWTKDHIAFYVDNKLVYTFAPKYKTEAVWPYNQPFYFILNVAVGGNFGGPEVDDTIFPQEFIIDYVKVYEK
ncbi:glycoside hydrolase family 16 protein [Flavobacterium salilacus subsp. salilacus]|uniref:glycoside hydrolase family 16 protein n=1 Tax=Flavobacterium TaxID=237 RepID=UPI0010755ECB|nr:MULTISPECIES: glycoside hydrolase family 16 protein [Flavobacterium]KAF2519160.1 glycoside hydrolase family 16 protein [Flavobacterium salilacus subsp. salilacus]MBE1613339.1 glycoside hydrolase family 16 protein [Flavobacterium sp. SaA2.13]